MLIYCISLIFNVFILKSVTTIREEKGNIFTLKNSEKGKIIRKEVTIYATACFVIT